MRLQQDLAWHRLSVYANVRGSLPFGHKEFSFADDANNLPRLIGNDDFRLYGKAKKYRGIHRPTTVATPRC